MKNNLTLCSMCAEFFSKAYNVRRSDPKAVPVMQACDHCEREDYCAIYEIARKKGEA